MMLIQDQKKTRSPSCEFITEFSFDGKGMSNFHPHVLSFVVNSSSDLSKWMGNPTNSVHMV